MFSKSYIKFKQSEYTSILNKQIEYLLSGGMDNFLVNTLTDKFLEFIKALSDRELGQLKIIPIALLENQLDQLTSEIVIVLTNRFTRTATDLWRQTFDLGVKHQVLDFLYQSGLWSKQLNKVSKFSSLVDGNLATFIKGDAGDTSPSISRARTNYTKLKRNLEQLKQAGLYRAELGKGSGIAARLTLEQKLSFIETAEEISDFETKSRVMEQGFISGNYLKNRIRVLSTDYAKKYDTVIKEELAAYLSSNIEGNQQIRNTFSNADKVRQKIQSVLKSAKDNKASSRARTILRTELALAYNFGKLSGFTSPKDMNRQMRINADWELEDRLEGYEVCDFCSNMDGRVLKVSQLLYFATRLDRGILKYRGTERTNTDFKNPSKPAPPPFHPNCNCYLTVEPLDEEDDDYEDEQALRSDPEQPDINNLMSDANVQQAFRVIAGTTLLVGGLFLLSRSNVFRSFVNIAKSTWQSESSRKTITTKVIETSEYLRDNTSPEIYKQFNSNLGSVIS